MITIREILCLLGFHVWVKKTRVIQVLDGSPIVAVCRKCDACFMVKVDFWNGD